LKPSSTPENSRLQLGDVAALGANVLVTAISNLLRKTEEGDVQKHLVGIETLVSTLLFFEASNPHDYIYSLVAIARDTPKKYGTHPESELEDAPFDIEVNYDNDPIDLFRLFTKLCVRSSESLDIICRHWAPDVEDRDEQGSTKDATFPTWILKVSDSSYGTALDTLQGRRAGDSLVGCPYRDMRKTYNAANSTKAIFIFGGLPPDDRPSRQNTRETISSEDSFSTAHLIKEKSWDDLPLLGIGKLDFARSTRILSRRASFNDRFRQLTPRFTASPRPQSPHAESSISHIAPGINLQNLLHVKGVKLGQIKKRSNPLTAGMVPSSWLEVAGWNRKNPGLVPDMLWRTLIADRGPDGHFPPRWYRRACSHCLSDASTKDYLDTSITPSSEILAQFLNRVRSVVYNRQFFAGGEGREPLFGLAPGTALKGDVVCVLAGCTVPVILRKDSGVYKFIGEAYVYGKMDGEAMAGYTHWDQDQLEEELNWFTMC
jgi:hypothetical protein